MIYFFFETGYCFQILRRSRLINVNVIETPVEGKGLTGREVERFNG